jgi:hypothetical protein
MKAPRDKDLARSEEAAGGNMQHGHSEQPAASRASRFHPAIEQPQISIKVSKSIHFRV